MRLHFASTRDAHACTYEGCTYACATRAALRQHQRVHTGERPYVCDVCAQAFAHSYNLAQHKRAMHAGGNAARFRCQQCNLVWKSKASLRKHLLHKHNIELDSGLLLCCLCCCC